MQQGKILRFDDYAVAESVRIRCVFLSKRKLIKQITHRLNISHRIFEFLRVFQKISHCKYRKKKISDNEI